MLQGVEAERRQGACTGVPENPEDTAFVVEAVTGIDEASQCQFALSLPPSGWG